MEKTSFAIRISEADDIDLNAFDQAAREAGASREEMVRRLMRAFLARLAEKEQYYTLKGYDDTHQRMAYIQNMDGTVIWNAHGIDFDSEAWHILEHAVDLVERAEPGDKEAAIQLFQTLFGERNVFVKEE